MRRVLVVLDDDTARQSLQLGLRREGYDAVGVSSLAAAERAAAGERFHFVVGRGLPAGASIADVKRISIVPSGSDPAVGLQAMAGGAHDFVVDSADLPAAVALALKKAEAREGSGPPGRAVRPPGPPASGDDPSAATAPSPPSVQMIGRSAPLAALAAAVRRVAPFKTTVLVRGESGTGKELVARALHRLSPRAAGPFVAVNCGAIPAGLMESELFGHRKGAFTDALRDRDGLLAQASGGTLFLDEIAELPLELQVKLLRVLEDDRVRRLGDTEDTVVDVRLVAATARDLESELAAGRFREDLFYRLDVLSVRLPPLRERRDDIPLLAEHFVARINQRLGLRVRGVSPPALRLLVGYGWPGNVRELENTIERAAVMCEEGEIDVASLPERVSRAAPSIAAAEAGATAEAGAFSGDGDLSIKRAARRAEEELIRRALAQTGGNRTRAAELLEISHRALLYKIKEYGVVLPMPLLKDGKF
jgi:two-component system response regulator AtoC